ncbi:MAG: hypothetical protein ACREHD_19195, partial [Pirellulales bacterium]
GQIISVQGDTGNYRITRFNSDGSVDTTFGQNGTVVSQASTVLPPNGVAVDGNANIIVCGEQNGGAGQTYVAVTRFNAGGSIDTTFGNGGVARMTLRGVVDDLNCLAIQSDGKILAGGLSVHPITMIGWDLVLMRYNTDGSLDSSFGNGGIVIDTMPEPLDTAINSMFVEPGGKIVAAGRLGEDAALFRFNPDGSLDTTFAGGGVAAASGFQHDGYGAVEQADGKYLLAGSQGTPVHFAVERFLGETPPSTSGISDVSLPENSPATVIALPNDFQGGSVPASQLAYSITADSSPSLFASVTIDPQTGNLTLAYARNQTGTAELTVRATDPDGAYVESTFNVTVNAVPDASLTPTATNVTAIEGATLTGPVATFTDADPTGVTSDFTATIDWGDQSAPTTVSGTRITEMNGVFSIAGGHAYTEEGAFTLTVTISDVGGVTATVNPVATVGDATLSAGTGASIVATEGAAFSGVVGGFTDVNSAAAPGDFTATITWSDGSTTQGAMSTVSGIAGGFEVSGTHVFSDEAASAPFTVAVRDRGGSVATFTGTAAVADAKVHLTAGATVSPAGGNANILATFTDDGGPEPVANYSATIDWGDG